MTHIRLVIISILSLSGFASQGIAADVSQLTKMEIQAGQYALAGNFAEAVGIYNQIIAVNPSDADVYLQRSLMHRELGDESKSLRDAAVALDLLDRKFAQGRKKPSLYRERANALRLLRRFPEAKTDMETAIQLSKSNKWVPDLQAIYLEEKIYSNK